MRSPGLFDLGFPDGERGTEPPRREGRHLATALGDELGTAPGVYVRLAGTEMPNAARARAALAELQLGEMSAYLAHLDAIAKPLAGDPAAAERAVLDARAGPIRRRCRGRRSDRNGPGSMRRRVVIKRHTARPSRSSRRRPRTRSPGGAISGRSSRPHRPHRLPGRRLPHPRRRSPHNR
jgi:hypothetical protein